VGTPTEVGRRLTNTLGYTRHMEPIVLLEEPDTLGAELLQEEEAEAKAKAEKVRPGLTMFAGWSRLDGGAAGCAVVWGNGKTWKGIKTHMGYNKQTYYAECAALAHALASTSRRNSTPEQVTIFTDAQAAIKRMVPDETGPGKQ